MNPSRDYAKIMSGDVRHVRTSSNRNPLGKGYFAGHAILVTSCMNQKDDRNTLTGFILEGGWDALAGRAAQKPSQQQPPGQLGRFLRHRLK